jgi:hypothetical protein
MHDCICSSDPADYLNIASASSAASSHGDLIPTSPSGLSVEDATASNTWTYRN